MGGENTVDLGATPVKGVRRASSASGPAGCRPVTGESPRRRRRQVVTAQ
jgi:hypothetical protein